MRRRFLGAIIAGLALSAGPLGPASASPGPLTFRFTTFTVPGATGTQVNGINDGGEFEGAYTDAAGQHGFLAGRSGLIRFDFPGTSGVTQAFAIDNAGDVVGVYTDAAGPSHGFLRRQDGSFTALPAPPGAGSAAGQGTFPTGITDWGEIVGFYLGNDGVFHGYVQRPDGRFTTMDAPGAGNASGQGTLPFSVDDRGVICGGYITGGNEEFGMADVGGHIMTLDDPATPQSAAGGTDADGFAAGFVVGDYINQTGTELGYAESAGQYRTVTDPLGSGGTVITATNDQLDLTGFFITSSGATDGLIANPSQPGGA